MDLGRLRGKLPFVAFVLLAAVCLLVIGFACACLSDQPAKAAERAVSLGSEIPAVIELWSFVFVAVMGIGLVLVFERRAPSRASPARLQRFLF